MRRYLGVDGGGTKTEFLIVDESGRVLAAHRAGSAYYLEIGVPALEALIVEGLRATLAQASLSPAEITFACIGLPAHGEDSALVERLDAIASAVLPLKRYRSVNDTVCGWAGALACRDGINLVAGTGSIAYGEVAGRSARAGGWGELFSDEGSAYWVAREALTLFSRMSDGRAGKGPLYDLMRAHFGVRADLDVCAAVYGPPPLTRSQIAALAPLAARAVLAGDLGAARLFATAAQELAMLVHAVRGQLAVSPQDSLPVSYSGGMFKAGSLLTPLLEAALAQSGRCYEFIAPQLAPWAGAVLYAAKLAGTPLTAQAVGELKRAHGAILEESNS